MNQHEIFPTGLISAITSLFLFIKIIWTLQVKSGNCKVEMDMETSLLTAKCVNNSLSKDFVLEIPQSVPSTVEVIEILELNGKDSRFFIHKNSFIRFTKVQKILIHHNTQIEDTSNDPFLVKSNKDMVTEAFQYIDTLQYLEFSSSALNDDYTIHLPKHLKILNVDRNNYQDLNAQWAEEITEITAYKNKLKNIPKLHYSGPPIGKLFLKKNPLDKMTVLDIAPLCQLTVLELNFSGIQSRYTTEDGYCDCMMLKQWATDVSITGLESVECVKPKGNQPTCSENILEQGRNLRKKCPLLNKSDFGWKEVYSFLKYTFLFILFIILLAVIILYVIRHFHLRNVLAAYHKSLSGVSYDMDVEEEEAFLDPE